MTLWELAVAGLLYANVARRLAATDPWLALAWGAYALANVGFVMSAFRMR